MKHLLIVLTVLLSACSGTKEKETTTEPNPQDEKVVNNNSGFTIEGEIVGAGNEVFFIETATDRGIIQVGQAQADADGKFRISAEIPGFGEYYLRKGESNKNVIPLVLVPGDNVQLKGNADNFTGGSNFSGTTWSSQINGFLPLYNEYYNRMNALQSKAGQLSEFEQVEASIEAKKDIEEYAFTQMKQNPENPYNLILFKIASPQFENFIGWDESNIATMKLVHESFEKKFPNSPLTRAMALQVKQLEQMQMMTSGKFKAPEIALPDPNGNEIKLSDLRGKYVLIDFWASWCGPCRRENPNVIRLYNKYNKKGFTIYSVSLDEDKEKWKRAIEMDQLVWKNHVSDLKGWQSPVVQLYEFNGIPYTVLVDKEGNIIAKGLRGGTLEWKLKELFPK